MILNKTMVSKIVDYLDIDTIYHVSFLPILEPIFWKRWFESELLISNSLLTNKSTFQKIYQQKFCILCQCEEKTNLEYVCTYCLKSIRLECINLATCKVS